MAESTNPDTPPRGPWVGINAVHWAFRQAPCPPELVVTLAAIATYAGEDGRGAYPSVATLAHDTGKSADQVSRDIKKLRGLAPPLLLLGDQGLSATKWPAGSRPVVYDLPLDVKGPKPSRVSKNKSGAGASQPEDPPCMDTPPRMDAPPLHGSRSPSRLEAAPRGGLEAGDGGASKQDKEAVNPLEESSSILPTPRGARNPERALTRAEDDDEKAEPKATPAPPGRDLGALLGDVTSGRRRHLQSADRPHRVKDDCTRPGCRGGTVAVPVSEEHPFGLVYCPECMVVPDNSVRVA